MEFSAERADVVFGEFGFGQWRADTEEFHRAVAGAEIVEVVEICSEYDILEALFAGDINKFLTQMAFAVKAPVCLIGDEMWVFKLICVDGLESDA